MRPPTLMDCARRLSLLSRSFGGYQLCSVHSSWCLSIRYALTVLYPTEPGARANSLMASLLTLQAVVCQDADIRIVPNRRSKLNPDFESGGRRGRKQREGGLHLADCHGRGNLPVRNASERRPHQCWWGQSTCSASPTENVGVSRTRTPKMTRVSVSC